MTLVATSDRLAEVVGALTFGPPVAHVYNPLVYARELHTRYLERWGGPPKDLVLLGMNPGPWGMAQTGVPFGEVGAVRGFLGLDGAVARPPAEHPKRPVLGMACPRSEVSGARLWGWIRERWGTPEHFFARGFVANYCPLAFLADSGRNLTPDKLRRAERDALVGPCDRALAELVEVLRPRLVIGVGAYAEAQARRALAGLDVRVGRVLHPSPASPRANRGWSAAAETELAELGVKLPSRPTAAAP